MDFVARLSKRRAGISLWTIKIHRDLCSPSSIRLHQLKEHDKLPPFQGPLRFLHCEMASPGEDVNAKKSGLIDFPQHLRNFFQRMRDDDLSHDVVFVVENERFPAHRCLLGAASPVLC